MKLEYIKINNSLIKFENSITYISASNDSGKSSLVYLIKFILGGKKSLYGGKTFFDDYKKYKDKNEAVILEWKINSEKYIYDLANDNLRKQGIILSPKTYYESLQKTVGIFGNNVNINSQIYLSDTKTLVDNYKNFFFPNNNESYNAFFIYKLLTNHVLEEMVVYQHFSDIAKIKKLTNSSSKIKRDFTKELSELEKKSYSKVHNLFLKRQKLKKMKQDIPDKELVEEIKEIIDDDKRIEEGIAFHRAIVNDYNSLIKEEQKIIDLEIQKLSGNSMLSDIAKIYNDFIENSEVLSSQSKEEIEKRILEFESTKEYEAFEDELKVINEDIKKFIKPKYSKLFDKNYLYENKFYVNSNKESIAFSLGAEDTPGYGNRQVNYILFILYLMNNSMLLNYFIMDTTVNNEIDEKVVDLKEIVKNNLENSNKIIWFLHPNNILNDEEKIIYKYSKDNPIFIKLKKI